jgi:hypothetical protein
MIIHIGTQKTGSKAIQHFLATGLAASTGGAMCFPECGREGPWHQPLFHDLLRGDSDRLEGAVREVAARGAAVGVLSCEGFYLLPEERIRLMHATVGDASIILFVRRQDQLINAMYNQLIKAHRVSFDTIASLERTAHDFNTSFDHMATVDRWGRVFGHDRVTPIVYDKRHSAVDLFTRHVGITHIPGDQSESSVNRNRALDLRGLGVLRLAKRLCRRDEDLPRLVDAAHDVLSEHFVDTYRQGDVYVFSPTERQAILALYDESNEALRSRYFPELPSLFATGFEASACQASSAPGFGDFIRDTTPPDAGTLELVRGIYHAAGLDEPCL